MSTTGLPHAGVAERPEGSRRTIALVCALLFALPFLAARFPPITDLAQHVAQVRLFGEALVDGSPYQIQWLTPYSLCYAVLAAAWAAFGPLAAGRVGALLLVVLGVVAIHWLAARRERPAAAAVLASVFLLSHVLYWGFLSFVAGLPLFVVFLEMERSTRRGDRAVSATVQLLVVVFLLYLTHALWFAAAAGWLVLAGLNARLGWRQHATRAAALVLPGLLAVAWFPRLAQRGFATPPEWEKWGAARLAPAELRASLLGGLRGPEEFLLVVGLALWIAVALVQHRRDLRRVVDRELLVLAGVVLLAALVLPDKYMNTIRFAQRWLPVAAIFAVLALPCPRLAARRLVALGLVGGFCGATALSWYAFDRREMAGFAPALDAIPPRSRVIGLDYLRTSPRLRGYPFFQMFAYAQVLRGGELNFSFADFAPSLVVYRELRFAGGEWPWTRHLEWLPRNVRRSDFSHFDYALIHAGPGDQAKMAERAGLEVVAGAESWRLYRVGEKEKGAAELRGALPLVEERRDD